MRRGAKIGRARKGWEVEELMVINSISMVDDRESVLLINHNSLCAQCLQPLGNRAHSRANVRYDKKEKLKTKQSMRARRGGLTLRLT